MAFAFRANAMDMSFHRNPNLFRSPIGQAGRLPASGLPQRGRMVDGEEALRAPEIVAERSRAWAAEETADEQ